jgi:hypothetical protein
MAVSGAAGHRRLPTDTNRPPTGMRARRGRQKTFLMAMRIEMPGGGPEVRSGLPGLSARVRTDGVQLLRLQLHVAASVQRVGIGPRGTVRHQSIFRGRGRAPGTTLSATSSRLLNMILRRACPCHRAACGTRGQALQQRIKTPREPIIGSALCKNVRVVVSVAAGPNSPAPF